MPGKRNLPTTLYLQYAINGKPSMAEDVMVALQDNGVSLMKRIKDYLSSQSYVNSVITFTGINSIEVEFQKGSYTTPYPILLELEGYQVCASFYY